MMAILSGKNKEFQKPLLNGIVHRKILTFANVVAIVILCESSSLRDIKMREVNRNHTRFQVKENDVISPGTCFNGEIVLSERELCYQSIAEISFFEVVIEMSTQYSRINKQSLGNLKQREHWGFSKERDESVLKHR
ncbi:hypothetical protein TNCV_4817951 [Trichonephila clavipes]|nr:hypothetical protein TNCV_4817951 [Trichonephila clavipes]